MRRVAVIGLGRFGMAVVEQLAASGVQVIAVDSDSELVDEVKHRVDVAVTLDSTDERALRSQDIHKVDVLIVAIGENFEAALLTAAIAKKQLKIPRVICRAATSIHAEIFSQIGADEVIQPESETGRQLARKPDVASRRTIRRHPARGSSIRTRGGARRRVEGTSGEGAIRRRSFRQGSGCAQVRAAVAGDHRPGQSW